MPRMHDMLMTETPRPMGLDEVYTKYPSLYGDATVIEATQVAALMMSLTKFDENVQADLKEFGGDAYAWQLAQFFNFDWDTIQNVAPVFDTMNIEWDEHEAAKQHFTENGQTWGPEERRKMVKLGRTCVSLAYLPMDMMKKPYPDDGPWLNDPEVKAILDLGAKWWLTATVFHYVPGRGLVGPHSTWFIPVAEDGSIYTLSVQDSDRPTLHAIMVGPDGRGSGPSRSGAASGWQALIPALLAVNFMHTPGGDRGYHERVPGEAPHREQKQWMRRTFQPLTKWYTLDIKRLRSALREANGGKNPDSLASMTKALRMVRGHYAHYPPNTYFGRKHDDWKTVFRPAYSKGDVAFGKTDKDYRVVP